ncbi:MAG TPA: MarC family protein [Geminicoccaceae bacterium]|nr:MarC family protein [Geminicoccus sp.]HMU48282.1 MarC family protein [Geminicoccaceae bacterium]
MAETFVLALTAFLVTIDPIGLVPIFIALTRGADVARRRSMAVKGVLIGGAILLLFALIGERALTALGIGMPAFRIAGGLLLLAIAFEMVFEKRGERRAGTAGQAAEEPSPVDVSVFPLGIPLIAGPAAITAAILQTGAQAGDPARQALVIGAMLTVLALVATTLLASSMLAARLGPTLVGVLSRLLGLILSALAVQQVIDGVRAAFLA